MKKRVAILTAFREFVPGYSLTGIVLDQVRLLERHGHEVDVFVCEDYHEKHKLVKIRKLIPQAKLVDYKSRKDMSEEHAAVAEKMAQVCVQALANYDIVLTHDFIFTGWNLPYGQGILRAGQGLPELHWLHWIHSIPSGDRDFWNLNEYGPKHKLVYPNRTDLRRVCEHFRTELENARVIPHPKDLRSWFDFDQRTCAFIDDFPEVMTADIVQVYPASSDRLEAKRLKEVILVFAEMKRKGFSVCLVVANQWATGRQRRESLMRYRKIARRHGLDSGEVIFTSEWRHPEFETGIPKVMIRELFQCSNLFLFPTREETFGLVLPEAVLAGGVLPVLNKSLQMMGEVTGLNGDFIDFGAFNQAVPQMSPEFPEMVADAIIGRLLRNESIMCKTYIRQRYNWDHLYQRYYAPIFAESINW